MARFCDNVHNTLMLTEKVKEVSCSPTGVAAIRRAGKSRLEHLPAAKFQGLALDFRVHAKVATLATPTFHPTRGSVLGDSKHVLPTEPAKDAVFAESPM